jgi:sulfate permease, SulP family
LVLNVEDFIEVDITGLDALESARTLAARGIAVALGRGTQDPLVDLEAYGLADTTGRERLYPLPTALAAYQAWLAGPTKRSPDV